MLALFRTALLFALASLVSSSTITVHNACTFAIDPAFYPAATAPSGPTGGFALAAGASSAVLTLPPGWSGRAWARTGCDAAGNCATGTCPGGVDCTLYAGAGVTLAQFTIAGYANADYVDPTAGDGFNVALTLTGCGQTFACTYEDESTNGCDTTSTCPTGTDYTLTVC